MRSSLTTTIVVVIALHFCFCFCYCPVMAQTKPPRKQATHAIVPPREPERAKEFLIVRGIEVWRGKYEFMNLGVNIPDLLHQFLHAQDKSAGAALKRAAQQGVRLVRCVAYPRTAEEYRQFKMDQSAWFAAFSRMLAAADALGISCVPTLLPDTTVAPPLFTSNATAHDYLKQGTEVNRVAAGFVSTCVTQYRDDPRVLFWEIGEEINRFADLPTTVTDTQHRNTTEECYSSDEVRSFLLQIATLIKSLDRHHLISSGCGDLLPNAWHLRQAMLVHHSSPQPWSYSADDDHTLPDQFIRYSEMIAFYAPAGIDIVSVHQAPPGEERVNWLVEDDDHAFRLPWIRQAAGSVATGVPGAPPGKPLFVGSIGNRPTSGPRLTDSVWIADFIKRARTDAGPVSALNDWQLYDHEPLPDTASVAAKKAQPNPSGDILNLLFSLNSTLYTASREGPYIK